MGSKKLIKKWVLYDGRAITDIDNAIVYTVCDTFKEAIKDKKDFFNDAVIYKETLEEQSKNKFITLKRELCTKN